MKAKPKATARHKCNGLVAVLDALGASAFNDKQIQRFVNNRGELIKALGKQAEEAIIEGDTGKLARAQLDTFTFGDTLVITYDVQGRLTAKVLVRFFALVRQFLVDSLANEILFRGSIGIGAFRKDKGTNTVMGDAVSDAASWYDRADWFGVIATPRASLAIERILGKETKIRNSGHGFPTVSREDGTTLRLKCVNWPKIFMVPHLAPQGDALEPRDQFLNCLENQLVPSGTESKYFNSLAFFDWSVLQEQQLQQK